MITKLSDFEKVHEAAKKNTAKTTKPKRGKMHKALGIPDDKEIKDVYKSGKKLAADLIAKVGKKKAASMLTFVANINKDVDVYDKAIKALKEAYEMDDANDAGTEHAKYVLSLAFDNEKEHNVYDIQKFYNDVANDIADDNIADMLKSSIQDVLEELTMEADKLQYVKRIDGPVQENHTPTKRTDINAYSWDELNSFIYEIYPHKMCLTTNANSHEITELWDQFCKLGEDQHTNFDNFVVENGYVAISATFDDKLKLQM